jgi:fibro-slime domain-containing protein
MNVFFIKNYKKSWHFSFKKNKFEGGMWHFKKAGLFGMPFGKESSMETKMMKKSKISLWKWALSACLLFAGVQNAFAACSGTVYFQAPSTWSSVYVAMDNNANPVTKQENGWYVINLAKDAPDQGWGSTGFVIAESKAGCGTAVPIVNGTSYNIQGEICNLGTTGITCPGEGSSIYVSGNPASPDKSVIGSNPPDAKYFFVMIPPDMEEWMSSVPMISLDGGVTGKPMTAVADMCGWYSYVFFNETITDNVVLFRDDDTAREDMIGLLGNAGDPASPVSIPLGMTFDYMAAAGQDTLFFVPDADQKTNDDGFYYSAAEVDGIDGTCEYTLAAVLYDTDPSLHPAFSCFVDGGNGVNNWNADCQTDATARAALQKCIGVTQGMVEETLGANKKPKLKAGAGTACFQNETLFNQMFTETAGVNEMSCYDMPFKRSKDGRWEFDSDYDGKAPGETQGGFSPLEYKNADGTPMTEAEINAKVQADGGTPLPAARTRHAAQGPAALYGWLRVNDPDENMPIFDLMCNGPGWKGGIDCNGHFGDGNDLNGETFYGTEIENVWCWGDYCWSETPADWPAYSKDTEKSVKRTAAGAQPRWASGDYTSGAATGTLGRNQHFCFESHAKFTHKPGLRFNFRGDDDIWVYIGGKLAVDLGGTHMAAPAYVNLDLLTDAQGKPLVVGEQYDIDIFFCDRRTTMSNVRITTNMYIRQKTDIQVKGKKNPQNPAEKIYELCYTKSGDGSCAAAVSGNDDAIECCGADFTTKPECAAFAPKYFLVEGSKATGTRKSMSSASGLVDMASAPGIYNCGIDLTNLSAPVIDAAKVCGLGAGRFALFVTFDGVKSRRVQTFTPAGELDVIYGDAVAQEIPDDENESVKDLGTYHLVTNEMGGKLVPVYVSNVGNFDGGLLVQPRLAEGMSYALAFDPLMKVYYKNASGDLVRVYAGDQRVIGESGVDTLWATVEMDDLTQPLTEFTIGVAGRPNAMHVSFYLPVISFVSAPDSTATQVTGQQPEADGTYEEHWVGTLYDLYLAILKPMTDAEGKVKYYPCKEDCEGLLIHKGAETSPKVDFIPEQIAFHDGYASIQVRSMTKYRWDEDATKCNPAYIVAEYNDYVKAVYTPMYFRDPPVPYPVLADVFDAHGALPTDAYKIPEPYFSENKEYLDGIGDSVAIYYDRKIHKDSIPTMMCILWDDTTTVEDIETLRHNPVAEGFSNIPKDTAIFCNALVGMANINVDCSNPVEYNGKGGYCTNVAMIGGVTLSEKVKTQGVGKVHSYAVFEDKGRQVKQGFIGALTDRIAPVPLRAEVRSLRDGDELLDYDSLVVTFSEPVKLLTTTSKKSALDFYLNSAVELPEDQRYTSALGNSSSVVTAESDPSIGTEFNESENRTEGRVKFMYKRGNVSPHVGDYLRMGGTLAEVFWSDADTTHTSQPGSDTLRSTADATYAWNSPTSYDETKRIPSPWIPVIGDAEIDVIENKFASTANVGAGDMPAITVNSYRTTMTKAEILAKENGRPGQLVKADMYALYNGLSAEEKASIDINEMYFFYEVQYFTNLGSYVASKSQRIYCNDAKNKELYNEEYFGGASCIDAGGDRNFYIGWNMRSDKGRVVGTGAYIMKLKSYVRLGDVGKDAKQETTSVYGVKRSPKEYTGWKADAASESK